MGVVVLRTNAGVDVGIGHLVRCVNLARELLAQGQQCLFVVDYLEPGILPFLGDIEVAQLYDARQNDLAEEQDAALLIELLARRAIAADCWVVVDEYRLGQVWEGVFAQAGHRVMAIDDLLRSHCCELLVDFRWRGPETADSYETLLPSGSRRLLGPSYVPLLPEYKDHMSGAQRQRGEGPFVIMIGSGGGSGNLSLTMALIEGLLASEWPGARGIAIYVVIGPLSGHQETLLDCCASHPEITPLQGLTNMYPSLCETDLYIGAAGGILYQLLVHQIPALTFSISQNQESEIPHLEDIGHFFHCNAVIKADILEIVAFAVTICSSYDRIRALIERARVPIDGLGALRIVQAMGMLAQGADGPPALPPASSPGIAAREYLSPPYVMRSVSDDDVNHYLFSRNLDANRQNMTVTERITQFSHYLWWFTYNKRDSFVLLRGDTPCLYIWHQLISSPEGDYLVGGWFVCAPEVGLGESLLALKWQLDHCDRRYQAVSWLGVISKNNKFVKLLNDYVGFTELAQDHPTSAVLKEVFPKASSEEFYFVTRKV